MENPFMIETEPVEILGPGRHRFRPRHPKPDAGTGRIAELKGIDRATVRTVPENRVCGTILEMLNHEGIYGPSPEAFGHDGEDSPSSIRGRIPARSE